MDTNIKDLSKCEGLKIQIKQKLFPTLEKYNGQQQVTNIFIPTIRKWVIIPDSQRGQQSATTIHHQLSKAKSLWGGVWDPTKI